MAEKILIIDDDLDTLRLVGMMLQRQGYEIAVATNGQQGLARAAEVNPDLIVLDIMMPDLDGYTVARRLRENPRTAGIPILMFTAKSQLDDKVAGFEVGADDYLTKPTHPAELQAHVRALLARSAKGGHAPAPSEPAAAPEPQGLVIGVIAARGGLGVSTVAVNLAATLYNRTRAPVILAELWPGLGTLCYDLGVSDPQGLNELLQLAPGDISRQQVAERLVEHLSGPRLLLASPRPGDMKWVDRIAQFEAIVGRLASLARYVVLDLGAGLGPHIRKVLSLCNECLVVVEGMPPTIAQTRLLLADLGEAGVDSRRALVVLNNRTRSDLMMTAAQVQDQLKHSLAVTLTPAPELFFQAARAQRPAVINQPEGLTGQQFLKLANLILEREAQAK